MTTDLQTENGIAQRYQQDGFAVVEGLLDARECDELKDEAIRILKSKPKASVVVGVAAESQRYYKLASDPRIVGVLRGLMPDGVAFMSDKFVYKSGAMRFATPWHVDAWYWQNTRPKVSIWIALDDVRAENGALVVLPGSHLKQWRARRGDTKNTNGEFDNVIEDKQWRAEDEVVCTLRKGGAIFFSDRLLHASTANTAGEDRFAIISTYHAPLPEEEFDKHFPARHVIVPPPVR